VPPRRRGKTREEAAQKLYRDNDLVVYYLGKMGKHNGLKQESLNNTPTSSCWAKETQPLHDKTTDAYIFPLTGTFGRKRIINSI